MCKISSFFQDSQVQMLSTGLLHNLTIFYSNDKSAFKLLSHRKYSFELTMDNSIVNR